MKDSAYMNKLSLVFSYFIITPAIIFLALIFTLFIDYQHGPKATMFPVTPQSTAYAALPATDNSNNIQITISTADGRVEIIRQFLAEYHSPLEPYATDIVAASDAYKIDYRLIPAIAMQESHVCKIIPTDSYNCYGYGIYTNHVTRFPNYQTGIWQVAKTLGTKYKDQGLTTPTEIMTHWTPSSNGSWAHGVQTFMNKLQ